MQINCCSLFAEVSVPFQKNNDGVVFPAVLSPGIINSGDLYILTTSIKEEKPWLDVLLQKHGAILFRGFDALVTSSDFNDVVEAFGYEELPYVGGVAPRSNVIGRVYTTNESPPDQRITFHHEMAYMPNYPTKLFFFCEQEPASGGETPIVLSHVIYERMNAKYPEFVAKVEKLGLIYRRVMGNEDDPSSSVGRGWKSTFSTTDKSIAIQRAAKIKMKLEWIDDGVIMITEPIPAIKYDEARQRKTWFNGMVAAYTAVQDYKREDKRKVANKTVTFGDGSHLPEDIIIDCMKIMQEESIDVTWRKGDVLLMDNLTVLHARKSFTPPRKILASLCK